MSGDPTHIALDWLLRIHQAPENAELRTGLAIWLSEDASHPEAYRKAEQVWRLTGQLPAASAPAAVFNDSAPLRRTRRRRWSAILIGALAACLIAVIAPKSYLVYQSDYRTGLGQQETFELEDGSRIHLDSESAIAVSYSANGREIHLLQGQAFFVVTKDQARPFSVDASALRITVTGTAFNVAIRPSQLSIAVEHGSVRVAEGDKLLAQALGKGDRLRWQNDSHEAVLDQVPAEQIAAWQQGQLVVRDMRIADVLDELRPHLPGTLALRDTVLGQQRITGVYDLHDADAALRAVVQPYKGKVSQWTPWLRVIERQP